jgi:hypothetical protein
LHTLLEHFYDSQRNVNAGSTRRLHRRQPVGSLLPGSRGGDRSKVHTRDGQEAPSPVPSQTASQSMQQPAIIWKHRRTMLMATSPL